MASGEQPLHCPAERNSSVISVDDKLQSFSGDGRCDSPGHNAKYGTSYSVIEVTTEKIVDFSLVQVFEVANSNAMEKEGLKRCLEFLERNGQVIDLLATDRYLTLTIDGRYLNVAKNDQKQRSTNQISTPLNSI